MRPRVLLADDHALLLDAFEKLLTSQCDIVGKVSDGAALVAATDELKPEIVVLDIAMPLMNGLDAGHEIKRRRPATRLVFLTMNEDPDLMAEAFRAGASGYLLKRSAASELSEAIREVARGGSYFTPLLQAPIASLLQHPGRTLSYEPTPRQRQVLQLIAEGRSMKEIAVVMKLTPRTVAFHKYRMMEQLKIKSTAELIQYAIKRSVV